MGFLSVVDLCGFWVVMPDVPDGEKLARMENVQ